MTREQVGATDAYELCVRVYELGDLRVVRFDKPCDHFECILLDTVQFVRFPVADEAFERARSCAHEER